MSNPGPDAKQADDRLSAAMLALLREYRVTMPEEALRLWAEDVIQALSAVGDTIEAVRAAHARQVATIHDLEAGLAHALALVVRLKAEIKRLGGGEERRLQAVGAAGGLVKLEGSTNVR